MVAIKTLKSRQSLKTIAISSDQLVDEFLHDPANVEDFVREGDLMAQLDHQHILPLLGICYTPEGVASLVSPLLERGDLRSYLSDAFRSVMVIEVIDYGEQIAQGMAYLSSLGIVHRDLALRNCLYVGQWLTASHN